MWTSLFLFPLYVIEMFIHRMIDRFGCPFRNRLTNGKDRLVFVTGCDSGIGHFAAKFSFDQGFVVFATVMNLESKGARCLHDLKSRRPEMMHVLRLDVTDQLSCDRAREQVQQYLAEHCQTRFHALINNAGVCVVGELDWMTDAQIDMQLDINLRGAIRVTKQFIPHLIQHQGRVINIGSINSQYPLPALSVYCASKFGLNGLSQSLRSELYRYGVTVCQLSLGDFAKATRIMERQNEHMEAMKRLLTNWQRRFYGPYIDKFQRSTNANFGLTSPSDFKKSLLHHHFNRMLRDVHPPAELISAPLVHVLAYFFFFQSPVCIQNFIINHVMRSYVQ